MPYHNFLLSFKESIQALLTVGSHSKADFKLGFDLYQILVALNTLLFHVIFIGGCFQELYDKASSFLLVDHHDRLHQ